MQIIAFEHGRFLDVTPDFPELVADQAAVFLERARGMVRAGRLLDAQGTIGAYLADMSIIGRGAEARRTIERDCTGTDCPRYLADIRGRLTSLNYR